MALIPTAPGDSVVYFFDFKPTLRASAAGVLLSTLFYGVVLHQVLTYGLRERGKRHPVEIWLVVLCASLSTGVFVAQVRSSSDLLHPGPKQGGTDCLAIRASDRRVRY